MKPYLDIIKLVWPLALGMVNTALMQSVDRAFLAQYSASAIEAVLPASTLVWVFMCFFQSIVGYSGVFVAQYHGAGDERGCRASYRAGMFIAIVSGLLMFAFLPLGGWLFSLAGHDPGLAALERSYYNIAILGGFFVYAQMAAASYFTGRGKTRIVFWVNLLGNALNVAIDPVLIFGLCGFPRLGIAGAACATVLSQFSQFAVLAIAAGREGGGGKVPCLGHVRRILKFGVPAGGYEVLNMLSFTVFVFVTGSVGGDDFAASNACFTVNYLLFAPMTGFAIGAQTLVGHARGRGDDREAALALRRVLVLGLSFAFAACAAVLALHRPILSLYASPDLSDPARFFSTGWTLLLLMSAWMLFDAADVILSGALKGAGDTRFVFWWMFACAFLVWLPLVFAVNAKMPSMPALWSTTVAYVVIISAGSFARWRRGRWRTIRISGKGGA